MRGEKYVPDEWGSPLVGGSHDEGEEKGEQCQLHLYDWILSEFLLILVIGNGLLRDTSYIHRHTYLAGLHLKRQQHGPPDRSPTERTHPKPERTDRFVTALAKYDYADPEVAGSAELTPNSGCAETGMNVLVELVSFTDYID